MKQQQNTLNQIANQLGIPEPPVHDHVRQLLADGQDIKAIKIVREELGLSLVEAKQYVSCNQVWRAVNYAFFSEQGVMGKAVSFSYR